MTNYIQEGKAINYTVPSGGVDSGDLVLIESIVGVCASTGVENDVVAVAIDGVYELPKVAGAISQGQAVYFLDGDVTTDTAGGSPWGNLVKAGVAFETVLTGATVVAVKLNA
jgi:predicted RecA/RadA family phage recombinase